MKAARLTGMLAAAAALILPATASAGKSYGYKVVAASGTSVYHADGSNGTGDAMLTWKLAKATRGAPNNAHLETFNGRTWIGDISFNYFGSLAASDALQFGKSCSSTVHSGQDAFNGAEPPLGQLALVNQGKSIAVSWTFLPLAALVFDDPDGTCGGVSGGPGTPDTSDPQLTRTVPLTAFTRKRLTITDSGAINEEGSLTWKTSVTLQRVLPKKKHR